MEHKNIDMAQIPYIEHRKRMFKAYQRENRLKWILVATNVFWSLAVFAVLFAR